MSTVEDQINAHHFGKIIRLPMRDSGGNIVAHWRLWRDRRSPASWVLKTEDGCERTLEATFLDSVHRVRTIADNYGYSTTIS